MRDKRGHFQRDAKFFKKGVDVRIPWCTFRAPFRGGGHQFHKELKNFLNFFQKGVDANFFSRTFLRPPFGGALPINGRESGTLVLLWVC